MKKTPYLCTRLTEVRALSSVGLERLPYKQRVGGSNPSAPTKKSAIIRLRIFYIHIILVCLHGLLPTCDTPCYSASLRNWGRKLLGEMAQAVCVIDLPCKDACADFPGASVLHDKQGAFYIPNLEVSTSWRLRSL